jgi:hypothetical protein
VAADAQPAADHPGANVSRTVEIALTIGIVVLAGGGLWFYFARRRNEAEQRAERQRRLGPVEHVECDMHRSLLAEKRGELSRTQNDPVKIGNLEGVIASTQTLLAECERQANRREALA